MQQQKFKEFNTLKYKPKPTVKTINFIEGNELLEELPATERPTYAEILKAAKNSSKEQAKPTLTIIKSIKMCTKNYVH